MAFLLLFAILVVIGLAILFIGLVISFVIAVIYYTIKGLIHGTSPRRSGS